MCHQARQHLSCKLSVRSQRGESYLLTPVAVHTAGGHSNSYYPTVSSDAGAPSSSSAFSNGPSASGGSPTAQNFPMLRVQVADQYRMMPPVSAACFPSPACMQPQQLQQVILLLHWQPVATSIIRSSKNEVQVVALNMHGHSSDFK